MISAMHRRSAALALCASLFAPLLLAQSATEAASAPNSRSSTAQNAAQPVLEEVLVSAQRRTESLQDTPISLTAFDSERLQKDGISNLGDIASSVPSLSIEPFPTNNSNLRIFIRGVGLIDTQITQDHSVGVYLDGAYIARSTGLALDVAELARIEVLRGPQGTLYGRNSTGGTINLVTVRPDPEALRARLELGAGNRELRRAKASVNVPLVPGAAAKLALLHSERDGFIDNKGPGGDFGDREARGYRLDLSWDVTEALHLDYGYDHSEIEFFNYTYQAQVPPAITVPAGPADALALNAAALYDFQSGRVSSMTTVVPLLESETEIDGHMLSAQYTVSEALVLKYIGAWRELEDDAYADLAASGSHDYRLDNFAFTSRDGMSHFPTGFPKVDQEQSSHELQLSGLLAERRLDYIAGLYYFEEDATEDNRPDHHQLNGPLAIVVDPAAGTTTTTYLVNVVGARFEIDNRAWALYGRLTWTPPVLEERLALTLGARHSEDERKARRQSTNANFVEVEARDTASGAVLFASPLTPIGPATLFDERGDRNFKDDSFEAIAEYSVSDTLNVYGKFSEAYKSGGFNVRDPDPARFRNGFDKEKVESYELGIKSEWLQRRLRLNADVFYSDFTDIQLNFLIGSSISDTRVVNAGEARMQGLELSATWLALADLLLMLDYAYLDADIEKATDPDTGMDVSDEFRFSAAPQHSYTAALDWTAARLEFGRLVLNVSYHFMDERDGSARSDFVPQTFLDDYRLLNARLGLYDIALAEGQLSVAVWGKNLEDQEYVINALNNLPHASRAVLWGEPRSYGVDLVYQY